MVWKVSVMGYPDSAPIAAHNAKYIITALKNTFDLSIYETCVAKHMEVLKRIGLL